jgi:DNA-binding PadR family transcriptional regulator
MQNREAGNMEKNSAPMTEAMYYILLALDNPGHGYAVLGRIRALSGGRVVMGPGTLYGVLTRMKQDDWIALDEYDGRRKTYRVTDRGHRELMAEYRRLRHLVEDGAFLKEEESHG